MVSNRSATKGKECGISLRTFGQWINLQGRVDYGMDEWFVFYIASDWVLSDSDNCYPGRRSGWNKKREKQVNGKFDGFVSSWEKRAIFSLWDKRICSCRTSCKESQVDNVWLNDLLTSTFTPSKSSSTFIDLFIVLYLWLLIDNVNG